MYNNFFELFLHLRLFPIGSCQLFWFSAPTLENGERDDTFPKIVNPHYFPTLNFECLEDNVLAFPEPNTESMILAFLWYRHHNNPNDWKLDRELKWENEWETGELSRQERRILWLERHICKKKKGLYAKIRRGFGM
jgi:hypothetical protein